MNEQHRGRGGSQDRGRGRGKGRGRVRTRGHRRAVSTQYAVHASSSNTQATHNVDCVSAMPFTDMQAVRANGAMPRDMTSAKFETLPLAPELHRALCEVFKYSAMTTVQSQSIHVALNGTDLLVRARTGTGKTLAFLLPTMNRVISTGPTKGTNILIISPTRELAMQIANEAKMTLTFVKQVTTQVVVGGTNVRADLAQIEKNGAPSILVATPGRLLDHLNNRDSGFAEAVKGLDALILDEADRLLDMGFAPDLRRIFELIPPVSARQTLLYSATMPADLQEMAGMALKSDYRVIDCVGEEGSTHEHVAQSLFVTSVENQIDALGVLLIQCMKVPGYKIIVFFTTARLTQFCAELFEAMGRSVLEIHSRKSQGHRNKVSKAFRQGKELIMFTSDVTARGLDYPDVTTVIQVGLPIDKDQYIHRIGRTARAGKCGSGVLLLADFEAPFFRNKFSDLHLQEIDKLPEDAMKAVHQATEAAAKKLPYGTKSVAFQAWLGFYNAKLKQLGWTKNELVTQANNWALNVAKLDESPALLARTAERMGLSGVQHLRIERKVGVPRSEYGTIHERFGMNDGRGGRGKGRGMLASHRSGRGRGRRGGRRWSKHESERVGSSGGIIPKRESEPQEELLRSTQRNKKQAKSDEHDRHGNDKPGTTEHVSNDGQVQSTDIWQSFSRGYRDERGEVIVTETW